MNGFLLFCFALLFIYLGIVTHLVYGFCVDIAFSSSSSALDFFNFFTKLLTAFSDHLPSIDESSFPFFHANKRFTIGGVNGSIFKRTISQLFPFRQISNTWFFVSSIGRFLFLSCLFLYRYNFFFDFRRRRVSVCACVLFSLDMIWMMSGLLFFRRAILTLYR